MQVAGQAVELLLQALALLAETRNLPLHFRHGFFGLHVRFVHHGAGAVTSFAQELLNLQLGFANAQVGIALGLFGDVVAGVLGGFEGAVEAAFYFAHLLHILLGVFQLEAQLPVLVAQPFPLLRNGVQKSLHLVFINPTERFFKRFLANIEGGNFHLQSIVISGHLSITQ